MKTRVLYFIGCIIIIGFVSSCSSIRRLKSSSETGGLVKREYIEKLVSQTSEWDCLTGKVALKLQNKEKILQRTRTILQTNKGFLRSWLRAHPDFSCVIPKEGTVAFLQIHGMKDSESMAKRLLKEKGIFFVPGSCFDKEGYMRLGLGQDPENFQAGLKELALFLKSVKPL